MTISRRAVALLALVVLMLLTLAGGAAFGHSWVRSDHNTRPAAGGSWYHEPFALI
jgi:hypothetical protein